MNDFVSVIIPALNAEQFIAPCIESLIQQSYPRGRFEIIVVDNGSQDKTVEIAEEFNVRIFKNICGNISFVRNYGASQALGSILAFIDSDCIAPDNWLKDVVSSLNSDPTIGAIGCWYKLPTNPVPVEKAWDLHLGNKIIMGYVKWLPSSNFIILAQFFKKIGGFNEALTTGEDYDISKRVLDEGLKLLSFPNIAVVHLGNPKSIIDFFRKEYWRGKGGLQILFERFPSVSLNSSIIFGILNIALLVGIFMGLFVWVIFHDPKILIASLIILFTLIFSLTIKTVVREKNISFFLLLALLYFLFGVSRGLALFDFKIWRQIIKGKRA